MPVRLGRRDLLRGVLGAGALAAVASACGADERPSSTPRPTASSSGPGGVDRLYYGSDRDNQFVDVRRPGGTARGTALGTVVLVHGGYWQASYGLDLMDPMAERFTQRGFVTWNVEYSRVSAGGGFPSTFEDVAASIDLIAQQDDVPQEVVLVGHSAGGHLAAWAASRSRRTPGGAAAFTPKAVISLSGLLALTDAATAPESGGAVESLMGGSPEDQDARYALADPARLVPAPCPVYAAQATQETVIPVSQAAAYVEKARGAGGVARAVALEGDHFTLIDPTAGSFATIEKLVRQSLT